MDLVNMCASKILLVDCFLYVIVVNACLDDVRLYQY